MPDRSVHSPGDQSPGVQPPREEADVSSLSLGDRLRSGRKAHAMSLDQVARELHLEESIISDLENEQFESLGAPVFVRGHLKLYARLIGLSEDDVLQAYRQAAPESDEPPLVTASQPIQQDINLGLWGFWVAVIVVVLAAVFYVFQPEEPPAVDRIDRLPLATESPDSPVQGVRDSVADAVVAPVLETPVRILPTERTAEPLSGAANELATELKSPDPTPPAESVAITQNQQETRLILIFGEESWVEIFDVDRRLLFGLQQPGVRRELSGRPPFRLLLGNARSVNIYVNDTPYSIPDDQIRRNVARFEITAGSDD